MPIVANRPISLRSVRKSALYYAVYALALAASIETWFALFRDGLYLDETGTYWTISAGFSQIWSRQVLNFPAYDYILWLFTRIFGTSEAALRSLSVLAMLGATWLMYRIARELFNRDVALLSTIIFCIDPIISFASINVRPYAFGALAITGAIYTLLSLRRNDSTWMAILFGFLSACVLYSHYLFVGILPALLFCFFIFKKHNRRVLWRQFAVAIAAFTLACLPIIPGVLFVFHSGQSHVYDPAPTLSDLFLIVAPGLIPFLVGGAVLLTGVRAAKPSRCENPQPMIQSWKILFCSSIALVPVLLLWIISVATPIHMFEQRHCLAAVPGIALCWGLIITRYLTRSTRLVLCLALLVAIVYFYDISAFRNRHGATSKYALAMAQKNTSVDNAPVVMCSSFPEADYMTMPTHNIKENIAFPQLSYYKLSAPLIPLPRALNGQAIRLGSQFLTHATRKHQRFLALADQPEFKTLDWLSQQASPNYNVHTLGVFDGYTKLLEFDPKVPATPPGARSSGPPSPPSSMAASRPARP
jgi:hypothetical protein